MIPFRSLLGLLVAMPLAASAAVTVTPTNYHGWPGSFVMSNGKAEVVVVPKIGRVMQFRFVGTSSGPFWEDIGMYARDPDPKTSEWGNFGGDKSWPSPQGDWGKQTGRGWPPPVAFDSMPVAATNSGSVLTLTTAVDPHYGIRATRQLTLDSRSPSLQIITTYTKVEGAAKKVGVWIITQLGHPEKVVVPIPAGTPYPAGYNKQSDILPKALKRDGDLLWMERSSIDSTKVGTDAETLLWVGQDCLVRIDSPRTPGAEYPDQGSSAEVYTNPNPKEYVELEMLGPLHSMKVGDKISQTNTYTLYRRSKKTVEEDVHRVLGK